MSHARRLAALTFAVNSHANLSVAYSSSMDARVDRRTLLRKLIDDRFHGRVAEFARAIGRSPSQVHQWLHGHRRLGDAGARHIEKTLPGLWQGYFDGEPPPSDLETVADRIKEIRKKFNLSQEDLAKAAGVTKSAVSQWERGLTAPDRDALLGIEAFYRVRSEWVIHGRGPMLMEGPLAPHPQRGQVLVPIYDVSAAAGAGAFVEGEQVADHLLVRADWLRELVGYLPSSDKVAIIQVRGDSMEPTLSPGDLILVERRTYTREELTDGIYVVRLEGALLVKRLQFVPGGIALISDNERYERQVVSDVDVIARVIYAWQGKRM